MKVMVTVLISALAIWQYKSRVDHDTIGATELQIWHKKLSD